MGRQAAHPRLLPGASVSTEVRDMLDKALPAPSAPPRLDSVHPSSPGPLEAARLQPIRPASRRGCPLAWLRVS